MNPTRRAALALGASVVAASSVASTGDAAPAGAHQPRLGNKRFEELLASVPVTTPRLELVLRAVVDVADSLDLGQGPWGHRYMVPITGGRFAGPGRSGEGIAGTVLPGGADRQLLRADGVKELDAVYELRTDDGVVLGVHNQVISDNTPSRQPGYKRSTVSMTAPDGKYDWLNRSRFVGTLDSLRPGRQSVLVGIFRVI